MEIYQKKNKESGFTLIELLVAITIFATFLTLASSALVNVLRLEQKANVLRKTQEDTRYILESIIREARGANGELTKEGLRISSAYDFQPATNPTNLILITTYLKTQQVVKRVYYLSSGVVVKDTYSKSIGVTSYSPSSSSISLNKLEDLKILNFSFTGSFVEPSNLSLPPLLRLTVEAESGRGKDFAKPELRADTKLVSSATPRSY